MNNFNAETHEYFIDDIEVPGHTSLLPEQNFFVSEMRLEELRKEGHENHSLIKMYFDTKETYNLKLLIGLEEWLKKNESLLGKLLVYEQPLFSQKYKFAGIPDAIFENAIVDFKRSFGNKYYHSLQLAGQQILAKENKIINKTRKWLIAWYDDDGFKSRNVYHNRAEEIYKGLIKKYYIDQVTEKFLKGEM